MKPVSLAFAAFGPYGGEVFLDFRVLDQHDIFLITGPTGSGKSSIFEAMYYALYGEISQKDRNVESFCSDFKKKNVTIRTYVELVFAVAGRTYRIRREPAQHVPYKNKDGFRMQSPQVVFIEETAGSNTAPLTNTREVNQRITDIIGLNADQFKKIIMIPQGSFQEFLLANTREKQDILRDIFGTDIYLRAQRIVTERSKEIKGSYEDKKNAFYAHLSHLSWEDDRTLPDGQLDVIQSGVAGEIEKERVLLQKSQVALDAKRADMTEQRTALQKAEQHNADMARWKAIKTEHAALEAQRSEMDAIHARITQGEKARNLMSEEAKVETYRKQWQAATARMAAQQKTKDAAQSAYDDATNASEALRTENERCTQLKADFPARRLQLKELENWHVSDTAWREKRSLLTEQEKLVGKVEDTLSAVIAEQESIDQACTRMRRTLDAEAQLTDQKNQSQNNMNQAERVITLIDLQINDNRQLNSLQTSVEAALQTVQEKEKVWRQSQTRQVENQAAVLARGLKDGAPCPVCGSTHHPHPTESGPEETAADVEAAEKAWRMAQLAYQEMKQTAAQVQTGMSMRTNELKQAGLQLADGPDWAMLQQAHKTQWAAHKETDCTISQALQELRDTRQKLLQEEEKLAVLAQRRRKGEAMLAKEKETLQALHLAVQTYLHEKESIAKRLPQPLPERTAFRRTLEADEKTVAETERAWQENQQTVEAQKLQLGKAESALDSLNVILEDAAAQFHARNRAFEGMRNEQFASLEAYREAVSDAEVLETLRNRLQAWQNQLQVCAVQIDQYHKTYGTWAVIETEPQTIALRALEANVEHLQERQTVRQEQLRNNTRIQAQLEELAAACRELEDAYALSKHCEKLINGDNAQRCDWETFVLSHYFEKVLQAANERLHRMSAGRYRFMRQDTVKDKRRLAGLELDVLDFYTGKPRSVGTLSGGERFKASLALALGLSDVVGAESGGIELSTMFIDEGFGTLDEDALDQTIDTLMGLQQHGRLVGIISHVQELKERIPAQLTVQQTDQGSRAAFRVGV